MFLLRLPMVVFLIVYQSAFLALSQIWNNKVRSTLTTIGIVIGVASVTAVIAALTGLQANVLSEFESIGTNKIFVFPYWEGRWGNTSWRRIRLTPEQIDGMLTHCPSISTYTRTNGLWGRTITYEGRTEQGAQIMGVDPTWHKIENRSVILGRPFSMIDEERARPVCLVNTKTREKLGMPHDCTGESLMIGNTRFLVIGVVETRTESSMFGGGENASGLEVFLPFGTVYRMQPWSRITVIALSRSPDVSEEAQAELKFFFRKRRRIIPGDKDNFRVEAVEQYLQQFKRIASTVTVAATGVVGISLLVGGVGIMNIMLVSVSERTREIGLRKAVGARPSAVLLQFLVEAVMLCFFGGLIGVLAGQGMTFGIQRIPEAHLEKAHIPVWAIAMSFGFAAGVGLIFGMFPAVKAARLDPIDALRHE
jgi:putative ABC transport system permease protein